MLTDVLTLRGPAGTVPALETAAGLAGLTVPDFCRRALARALGDAARQLEKPVKRTRRSYPYRGGIALPDLAEEADSNG